MDDTKDANKIENENQCIQDNPVLYLLPKSIMVDRQSIPSFAEIKEELISYTSWDDVPRFSFVAHNWFNQNHPDTQIDDKAKLLVKALRSMRRLKYIWIDFSCIDTHVVDLPQYLHQIQMVVEKSTRILILPMKAGPSSLVYDMTSFSKQAWCICQACYFLKRPSKIRLVKSSKTDQADFNLSLMTLPSKEEDVEVGTLLQALEVAEKTVRTDDFSKFQVAFDDGQSPFPVETIWEFLQDHLIDAFGSRRDLTDFLDPSLIAKPKEKENVSPVPAAEEKKPVSPSSVKRPANSEPQRADFATSDEFNDYVLSKLNQYTEHDKQLEKEKTQNAKSTEQPIISRDSDQAMSTDGNSSPTPDISQSPVPGKNKDSEVAEAEEVAEDNIIESSNFELKVHSPAPTKKAKEVRFAKEEVPVTPEFLSMKQKAVEKTSLERDFKEKRQQLSPPHPHKKESSSTNKNYGPWTPAEKFGDEGTQGKEGFWHRYRRERLPKVLKALVATVLTVYTATLFVTPPCAGTGCAASGKFLGTGPLAKGSTIGVGEYLASCPTWSNSSSCGLSQYFYMDYDGQLSLRSGTKPPTGEILWHSESSSYPRKSMLYKAVYDKKGNLIIAKDKKIVKKIPKASIPAELLDWVLES